MPRVNVDLLLKVKKHILAKPSRLHMDNFLVRASVMNTVKRKGRKYIKYLGTGYNEPGSQILPDCGAVACIRGWAAVIHFGLDDNTYNNMLTYIDDILGLNFYRAKYLYFIGSWPEYYRRAYMNAKTQQQRAKIVGQAIDLFIKYDGDFTLAQPSDFTEVTRRRKSKSPVKVIENLTPSPDTL